MYSQKLIGRAYEKGKKSLKSWDREDISVGKVPASSLIPQNPHKKPLGLAASTCNPGTRVAERRACWSDSPAESVSPRFGERLCHKEQDGKRLRKTPWC